MVNYADILLAHGYSVLMPRMHGDTVPAAAELLRMACWSVRTFIFGWSGS